MIMAETYSNLTTGGCLCGAVRFQVAGVLRDVVNCHCSMCQKLHGSFGAHSKARKSDITLIEDRGLKWHRTSKIAQRGFCKECGSSLFWRPDEQDATGILAGSLDQPTGLNTLGHIFISEKADFYDITDSLPQFGKSSDGALKDDSL